MKNSKKMAEEILQGIGGKANITSLVHCMTRLRFTLKDESLIQKQQIENTEGVLGTMAQNGQFQIIIGQTVPDVYAELCGLAGIEKMEALNENLDADNQGQKKFRPGAIFEVVSGCFAPVVTAFAGAGILKGILTLLTTYSLLDTSTGLYLMLNAASDATFYFLPFLLAYTSAKRFKTNEIMALILAGIYMYPTIINNAGTQVSAFGISFYLVKYSSSVIPIMLSVWVMSYVHRWISKVSPSFLRVVLVPVVVLLVMTPLSLMLFGPLGYNIGIYIGNFFKWLFDIAPMVGGFVDGFTRPLMVFTGTHMTMSPIMINNIETLGYDMLGPVHCVATVSAAGMCFGAFLKAKKESNKAANFSSFISAAIGITEPALYGVAFRFKRPLAALCIGGGVSGAFVAAMGAKALSFAMPALISLPVYTGTIPIVLAGSAIGFVLTAVLTYVLGFDEDIKKDERAIEAEKKNLF